MELAYPWDTWIPGVLSASQLKALRDGGYLRPASLVIDDVDQSSFDLTLDAEGYHLPQGSVKPAAAGYLKSLVDRDLAVRLVTDEAGEFLLSKRNTYLFKVRESFTLKHHNVLAEAGFYGQATARSSVGRLDVLARLIFDGMSGYETFDPEAIARGNCEMFLEITPLSFNVKVKAGIALSQLRIFYGKPEDVIIRSDALYRTVLRSASRDGSLSVDLTPTKVGSRSDVVALSPRETDVAVRLWKPVPPHETPKTQDFWDRIPATDGRLRIEPAKFYILRSRELICMPSGVAVYCRASDETLGEMRIHYAGFVHPFFGSRRSDGQRGTPLIFEVRGHDFAVNLEDGEVMARLTFYRLSEDPDRPGSPPSYNDQVLRLSGFFPEWPVDQ